MKNLLKKICKVGKWLLFVALIAFAYLAGVDGLFSASTITLAGYVFGTAFLATLFTALGGAMMMAHDRFDTVKRAREKFESSPLFMAIKTMRPEYVDGMEKVQKELEDMVMRGEEIDEKVVSDLVDQHIGPLIDAREKRMSQDVVSKKNVVGKATVAKDGTINANLFVYKAHLRSMKHADLVDYILKFEKQRNKKKTPPRETLDKATKAQLIAHIMKRGWYKTRKN
jgi:hypothetical protein